MKIYYKISEKNYESIRIFSLPVFTKTISDNDTKTKYLFGLFKTKEQKKAKKYYFLGIQFFRKKKNYQKPPPQPVYNVTNAFIMEYFCDRQQRKFYDNPVDIKELLNNSKSVMLSCSQNYLQHSHGWTKYLFKGKLNTIDSLPFDNKNADLYVLLGGVGTTPAQISVAVESMACNKPTLILESAFLRSINTFCEMYEAEEYRYDIGFVLDYLTAYYDATRPSYLENLLNDKNLVIKEDQKQRARNLINKIVQTHLTKYNCQPIFTPEIGRKGRKKILVVDQSFGDNSVKKGLASISTFDRMLKAAIEENPGADIIIKTHPDTETGARTGYYSNLQDSDNIYLYRDPINPISLLNYSDKVYVCTSQLGFEALMCNKETHIFGMPFYAGWGCTNDRQICERRKNKRTLEEIFYIAYILYSHYVNPVTQKPCEIEDAIEQLLSLRDKYFRTKNKTHELQKCLLETPH